MNRSALPPDKVVSAQVLLRATSASSRPDPSDADAARAWFEGRGFTTGEVLGISFTISAPASLFDQVFGVTFSKLDRGGLGVLARGAGPSQSPQIELPLDTLPAEVKMRVTAVTLGRPLDFGPGFPP